MDFNLDIQKLAEQACTSIDYKTKSRAQQYFYNLCINLNQQQIYQLLTQYSQRVLFVIMQYLYKVLPLSQVNKTAYLIAINKPVQLWYNNNTNCILYRNNKQVQKFVKNSIGRTIGQGLKHIYLSKNKSQSQGIIQFIKTRQNQRYRLYLWNLFIQTVSVVDSQLSFLVYRAMVYNFQQYIIPQMMDDVLPYFNQVRQQIQINDLSALQSNLVVTQQYNSINRQKIQLFNPSQIGFTQLVFSLLKQIICFNYNITYSQYQSQIPIQNCLISFPDTVTKKIVNKQFLISIFYVSEKLIKLQNKSVKYIQFLNITFQCLKKIMLTKLFYISHQNRQQFIKTVLKCLSRLIDVNIQDKITLSVNNISQLKQMQLNMIQINTKLLINIQFHQLLQYKQQSDLWFSQVTKLMYKIINQNYINYDNYLITQTVQLAAKIVQQSISPQLKQNIQIYKNMGIQIVMLILQKILSQQVCIIDITKIRNWQQLKKNISLFLRRIRQLLCINLKFILQKYQSAIFSILGQFNNTISISNIFLLISQLCDRTILQRNMLYQQQQPACKQLIGKILYYLLQWITQYRKSPVVFRQVQISSLIFIQKLLSQVLSSFTYQNNQIKILCQLYKGIQQVKPQMKSQLFLQFCYNQIAYNLTSQDFSYASYTFQVLSTQLLKFKYGIKRQYFKQTSIAKNVLNLCRNLSQNNFDGQKLILRKQLYKIITSISFDDILDDYRTNLNQLILGLQKSTYDNIWKALYDLTGICQAIDTSVIYRYFLLQNIKDGKIKLDAIKAILKMNLAMIDNKGQRLSGNKNSFYHYKMISTLMPYWKIILQQRQMSSQSWDQIILLIYQIFNTLLRNNNTNFYVLQRIIPNQYNSYFQLYLQNMISIGQWVQMYPELFAQYKTSFCYIAKQLLQIIFNNKNIQIIKKFVFVLVNVIIAQHIKYIDQLQQGNKNYQQTIQTYLQITQYVFKYLRNAQKLTHKVQQINNMNILNQFSYQMINYMIVLFRFGITINKKIPKYLDYICKVLQNMDFIGRSSLPMIKQNLGLSDIYKQQLLSIWAQKNPQSTFYNQFLQDNQFLSILKSWFKKCDTSTMVQPDY